MKKSLIKLSLMATLLLSFNVLSAVSKPNILFILVDDASPEAYSAYGIEDLGTASTPNIDSIADNGVIFATALAPSICQPSRVQIMTGRYANRTGNYYNAIWHSSDATTLYQRHIPFSKVLKDAGYATAIAGKWDAGPPSKLTSDVGFDQFMIKAYHNQIKNLPGFASWGGTEHYEEPPNKPSRYWYPAYTTNVVYNSQQQAFTSQLQETDLLPSVLSDYGPNLEARFISGFIEKSVANEQPFLAYWPTVAPHGTGRGRLPSTPTRGVIGDLGDGPYGNSKPAVGSVEYLARFQALNEYLDSQIGEVLAKIRELGIEDNTIIIFASDNATAIAGKTRGVERGSHVALMLSGPGIKQRAGLSTALTDTSDLAPTLIELALVSDMPETKHDFDGRSLVPFLSGQAEQHRDWIYANTAGSQILRTEHYLLEAVNQLYPDYPDAVQGRFYYTGDNRFGQSYQLLDQDTEQIHVQQRARFQKIIELAPLPSLSRAELSDDEISKLTAGNDTRPDKHLFNDKYHKFYPEDFSLWSNLTQITEQLTDSDLDTLPDHWESNFGLDILNSLDANQDADQDGLTNLQEYQYGSNPNSTDSDGDTLPDNWEVNNQLDPLNPNDALIDNDNDDLSNILEYQYLTSPHNTDSDGDTLPDGWEARHHLDPTNPDDAELDTDSDELSNVMEFFHGTEPLNKDSDADGLPDGWEITHQLDPLNGDDAQADNDNDDISNIDEYLQQSDPNRKESTDNTGNTDNNESGSPEEEKSSAAGALYSSLIVFLFIAHRQRISKRMAV
ncbi:sulfatase-like hydrolase/transferase [Thalassotalea fonticola]|uniref:Sulfatase-like hydrolase/transferase n=1 Tax=Thalassotalea fonticola TaxID=3065649 RepID=A0ABZ0GQQ7_9GAMM|nr:sulfatase-like hydrolase/transferase [Colwelliaceae bacterium S1-1]